jgi:hypothetical protein
LEDDGVVVVDQRQSHRSKLFLAARLHAGGGVRSVTVRNLSIGGALIDMAHPPPAGTAVELSRGDLRLPGTIVWVTPGQCGMHFDSPADLDLWLPAAGAAQRRVDAAVARYRAGDRMPEPPAGESDAGGEHAKSDLKGRVSEELSFVGRLLEAVGDDLADDPLVAARHAGKLQNLDISIQILGHLGRVIEAEDPEAAIGAIGMADLRRRLQRKRI